MWALLFTNCSCRTKTKIHSMFHVSQLKAFSGTAKEPYLPLSLTTTTMGPVLMPTAILRTITVITNGKRVNHGLIQCSESEATWEELEGLKDHYPFLFLRIRFLLMGKVM